MTVLNRKRNPMMITIGAWEEISEECHYETYDDVYLVHIDKDHRRWVKVDSSIVPAANIGYCIASSVGVENVLAID